MVCNLVSYANGLSLACIKHFYLILVAWDFFKYQSYKKSVTIAEKCLWLPAPMIVLIFKKWTQYLQVSKNIEENSDAGNDVSHNHAKYQLQIHFYSKLHKNEKSDKI